MSTPSITGRTRVGAVIGWPVEHSRSPHIHNAAFAAADIDAVFVAMAVAPEGLADCVRGMAAQGMLGASVTVPHKESIIAYVDEMADSARAAGAVNCLSFDEGRVIGHNTDAGGFVDAVHEQLDLELDGKRAVLLGAGGAARAVHAGLTDAGCQVSVVARKPMRVTWIEARPWNLVEMASLLGSCDLLVDCTPVDLGKGSYPVMPELDRLPGGARIASLVYGKPSRLLDAATEHGLRSMDGSSMLVHQGARAFQLWTGREAPLEVMRDAMRD